MNIKVKSLVELLPFGLAVAWTFEAIIPILLNPSSIDAQGNLVKHAVPLPVVFASFGLIVVLIFIIQRKHYWKIAFAILLFIAFTPLVRLNSTTFSFGLGGLFNLELITLIILVLHFAVNRDLSSSFKRLMTPSKQEYLDSVELDIEFYASKFSAKRKEELQQIIEDESYVPEAIEAAKRLLANKL